MFRIKRWLDNLSLAGKLTAILAIVGIVLLPIIKFSVDWWWTLHQSSTRLSTTLDPVFRTPLWVMALGFLLLFAALHLKAMRNEVQRRRLKSLLLQTVERSAGAPAPDHAV